VPANYTVVEAEKTADKPDRGYATCACGCGEAGPGKFRRGHHQRPHDSDYRTEDCGHETACWIWQKALDRHGYGVAAVGRKMGRAHRVYYERHVGPISAGLQLDHLCRNPACVNPAHLEPVTNAENSRRGAKAKLTWADAEAIRASSLTARALAEEFGVSFHTVKEIRRGRTWVAR
jgi:hypothetical protein